MKKFDKALGEIKNGLKSVMYDAIAADERICSYEYDFGNTTIMVEVELIVGGCCVVVPDVWIERDDCEHQSPKVIQAVKDIIPDWWAVTQEVQLARWEERENEKMMLANMMY